MQQMWSFSIFLLAVLALIAAMLVVGKLLGQKRHEKATDEPFESGIRSVGSARLRFSISYIVVAIMFVIFDLEVVFLYAWAVSFEQVGLAGLIEALIFILVLLAALLYLWLSGALDWGPATGPQERAEGD